MKKAKTSQPDLSRPSPNLSPLRGRKGVVILQEAGGERGTGRSRHRQGRVAQVGQGGMGRRLPFRQGERQRRGHCL